MNKYCQLWLSCANQTEAAKIADELLARRLIACAKQIPVSARYRWQGKIEQANEVLLLMESRADLFSQIEKVVTKIHSYDTFVLEAAPLVKLSAPAASWLNEELLNEHV